MQIWAESGKSALPICNYSQILYQFLTFTQNLKRSQFHGPMGTEYRPIGLFLILPWPSTQRKGQTTRLSLNLRLPQIACRISKKKFSIMRCYVLFKIYSNRQ